jgi:hypothetical protein
MRFDMDLGRIKVIRKELENENLSWGESAEVEEAFNKLVKAGAVLRDVPDNATIDDMLDELEDNATTVEKTIYEWVKNNFGESEANNPTWSTHDLAKAINKIPVIEGADNSQLGQLLGEVDT